MPDLTVTQLSARLSDNIEKVIVGKRGAIRLALVALLAGGHVLIEDIPGVAKTMLARSLALSVGGTFRRLQCTPDLLPSDITGVSVFNQRTGSFDFMPGPAMSNVLLADEINRATPRTQSALLECMAEQQISVDGVTHLLPTPFIVLATQNPIEYEGTFPLPEAQLDRFSLRLTVGYPGPAEESEMLVRLQLGHPVAQLKSVVSIADIVNAQEATRAVFVHPAVREYIIRLVTATRTSPHLALGASPRGSLALFRCGQALAAIEDIPYVLPDHIRALVGPVLAHRVIVKPESRLRGRTGEGTIEEVADTTPAPAGEEFGPTAQ
jgi:MoxR-like ATPase